MKIEEKFGGLLSNLDGRLINTLFNIDINMIRSSYDNFYVAGNQY